MQFLAQLRPWLRSNAGTILLVAALFFLNIFSLSSLTTRPRLWYDEGINIELARNFSLFGKLDLIVAPNTLSGEGAFIGSTGYPVTMPLAITYRVFGFGLEQSRLYMLLWMNLLLVSVFLFAKKRWGSLIAALVTLLFVTYPPFYGNGRTVMGEIPGFFFLLMSLSWYLEKRGSAAVGFLAGLAVIAKPSVYVFALPVYAILYLLGEKNLVQGIKRAFNLGVGAIITLIPWVVLYRESVLSADAWVKIADHFANPYAAAGLSILGNIRANLGTFLTTGTLIYMTLFAFGIALVAYTRPSWRTRERPLLLFAALYGICAFLYYLKSAGYLRYLIALQFLLLMLIVPAVAAFLETRRAEIRAMLLSVGIGALLFFQTVYLFTGAKLYYGTADIDASAYVREHFPQATFATINYPTIAGLLPPEKRYAWISTYGLLEFGTDIRKLPEEKLPDIVFIGPSDQPNFAPFLGRYYVSLHTIDEVFIFGLRGRYPFLP
jgi:4-amino-4-deoxy-L-arabinose transferase-like glycosyltransferase